MENFLQYLNDNAGALTVLFTGIVTFSTVVYAILTWRLVAETRKMRKVQTEPLISVTIRPLKEYFNFLEMVIENIGFAPAENIKFVLDQEVDILKIRKLNELNIIKDGINYLAPHQSIAFLCADLVEISKNNQNLKLNLDVSYKSQIGDSFNKCFVLDFSQYFGILQLGDQPLVSIKKSLENIQKYIQRLVSAQPRFKVDTYNSEDRATEIKKLNRLNEVSQKK